ncbi:DNA polymerase alpha subunit B isoform X3 [Penaeus vannamei]
MENFQIYDASTIDEIPGEDENDLLLAYGGTPTPKQRSKRQLTPDNNIVKRHVGPSRSISAQFSPASISQIVSTPSQKYSSRNNAGNIVSSFGEMKKETWKADMKNNLVMRVIPMGGDEVLSQVYKYMFEKVRDAADVLDDVITSLADQMITDLNTEEYSQLRLPSNEAVCAAGRICCDSVGRLNFASVLLEGSREISSGSAVPLDLTHLSEFSLFPGQVSDKSK